MSVKYNKHFFKAVVVCGLSSIFVMLQFTLQVTPGIMIAPLMKSFSIDIIKVSVLSSSYFYTYLVLQTPSGMLVDKFGPRKVLIWSVFFSASACMMFVYVEDFYIAVCFRMLMGLASAPAISVAFALCARWFPPQVFAVAIGIVEAGAASSVALAQYGLGLVVESSLGWRGAIFIVSISGFLLLFFVTIFVGDGDKGEKSQKHNALLTSLLLVIKKPQVWIAGVYSGVMFVVIAGFASLWCVPYIQTLYQVNLIDATLGSSSIFCGAAIGAPLSGWLSDMMGKRKPIMYVFAVITLLVSIVVIYFPPDKILRMYLLLVCLGFFSGAYMIPFAIIKEITSVSVKGTAMGFTNMMCILLGAPIFQPVVGILLDYSVRNKLPIAGEMIFSVEDYQLAFVLFPISFVIGILIVFFIKETYCRPVG